MPRRSAQITQADISRVIRAAQKEGISAVELWPDGHITVRIAPNCAQIEGDGASPIADDKEIVL